MAKVHPCLTFYMSLSELRRDDERWFDLTQEEQKVTEQELKKYHYRELGYNITGIGAALMEVRIPFPIVLYRYERGAHETIWKIEEYETLSDINEYIQDSWQRIICCGSDRYFIGSKKRKNEFLELHQHGKIIYYMHFGR